MTTFDNSDWHMTDLSQWVSEVRTPVASSGRDEDLLASPDEHSVEITGPDGQPEALGWPTSRREHGPRSATSSTSPTNASAKSRPTRSPNSKSYPPYEMQPEQRFVAETHHVRAHYARPVEPLGVWQPKPGPKR
jgi:hypothetical protein